jgi:arabinogalactan endo-1,4-beta-galactosidase
VLSTLKASGITPEWVQVGNETDLMTKSKAIEGEKCLGIFYWEPQAYGNWNGYTLGAFDDSGKPTVALNAFK